MKTKSYCDGNKRQRQIEREREIDYRERKRTKVDYKLINQNFLIRFLFCYIYNNKTGSSINSLLLIDDFFVLVF